METGWYGYPGVTLGIYIVNVYFKHKDYYKVKAHYGVKDLWVNTNNTIRKIPVNHNLEYKE